MTEYIFPHLEDDVVQPNLYELQERPATFGTSRKSCIIGEAWRPSVRKIIFSINFLRIS
jgi:hypothetical protein